MVPRLVYVADVASRGADHLKPFLQDGVERPGLGRDRSPGPFIPSGGSCRIIVMIKANRRIWMATPTHTT